MARRTSALWFAALLALGLRSAQEPFSADAPGKRVTGRAVGGPDAYDADLHIDGHGTVAAGLRFVPGRGDLLRVVRVEADGTEVELLSEGPGAYANPRLTRDAGGTLWLTYELRPAGAQHWNVAARMRRTDGSFGAPILLGAAGANHVNHDVAASPAGWVWVAWQADNGGQWDVYTRIIPSNPDARTSAVRVSESPRGDWHPSIAFGPDGWARVVWDSFDGQSFNVLGRRHEGDAWGPTFALADTPAFEARARVVCDSSGRTYVAWEEGAENWGKPYRSVPQLWNNATDAEGPLHRVRRLRLGEWTTGGALVPLEPALPLPSLERARGTERRPGVRDLGVYYERCEVAVDGADRLWVAYRHYANLQLGFDEAVQHHIERGWTVYARCLTDRGWSPTAAFDQPQRDGTQRLSLAPTGEGLALLWTVGRTDRREDAQRRGVVLGQVEAPPGSAAPIARDRGQLRGRRATLERRPRPDPPAPAKVGGRDYELVFGDLHRHTDLSLCFPFFDGSLDDAYRYGTEVAALDFLAVTDHARDLDQGRVQHQLWWRSVKEVERHGLAGRFAPFFAYERSQGATDHNVISLRPDMLRPHKPPLPEFWAQIDDRDTITIPHNTAQGDPFCGRVWEWHDDAKRPLLEIYQGFRDRGLDQEVIEPLNLGYHLGFIASSDHLSTSASYACVWVEDRDRETIFRALQARRSYGATAPIRLVVRSGQHWMGTRFASGGPPPIAVEVSGTGPLERVELVRDGEVVARVAPEGSTWTGELDAGAPPPAEGETWMYVRVVQADGERAWSSPLWVRAE